MNQMLMHHLKKNLNAHFIARIQSYVHNDDDGDGDVDCDGDGG